LRVAIIGQGYVGFNLAICAAEAGHVVTGYDKDDGLIGRIADGTSHIEGITNLRLSSALSSGTYIPSSDSNSLSNVEVVIIAVPTPLDKDRSPDLSAIKSAVKVISSNVKSAILINNESTSYPGTLRNEIAKTISEDTTIQHLYAASPERVDPGNKNYSMRNTARLISGLTTDATVKAHEFYSTFCNEIILVDTPEIAEMAKLFENTFRQVNIALVNELAQIANVLEIPVRKVIAAAASKPYGFMEFQPSAGVGGHCIPVDPNYLAYVAERAGVAATFIARANQINLEMPEYIVYRVKQDFGGELSGIEFNIIGVAYKANVSDIRETPARRLIELLNKEGASVKWHDPLVKNWNNQESSSISSGDALIIVTLHDDIDINQILKANYVFDCTGKIPGANGI
jgi:UDP-N-acetyl-D-glucosamine dehydrogenase